MKYSIYILILLLVDLSIFSQEEQESIFYMNMMNFMDIEVTSTTKKEEKLFNTTSSIYVITNQDIKNSGLRTLPEILRLVPGLNVSQINTSNWAITSRGFNYTFANKLLVMIDGRSIYTPLYGGVHWDVQDILIEDIERIEIIRGPGATIWGSNAVNGVININTKPNYLTNGTFIEGGIGTETESFTSLRYGKQLTNNLSFRIYTKYSSFDDSLNELSNSSNDSYYINTGGFKFDYSYSDFNTIIFQGDIYSCKKDFLVHSTSLYPPYTQSYTDKNKATGNNFILSWISQQSDYSKTSLQLYFDKTFRDQFPMHETRKTIDCEFNHKYFKIENHEIIWGVGYRTSKDKQKESFTLTFDPDEFNLELYHFFIQDNIDLTDSLSFTIGTKVEDNTYTNTEYQPSMKFLYIFNESSAFWSSIAKATRIPHRFHRDAKINYAVVPSNPFIVLQNNNQNNNFLSEDLLAYELGYRFKNINFLFDISLYYNKYDNLSSNENNAPYFNNNPIPHLVISSTSRNYLKGNTYGLEFSSKYRINTSWNMVFNYSYFKPNFELSSESNRPSTIENEEGNYPKHQFSIQSMYNYNQMLNINLYFYYIDELKAKDIPSYERVDLNIIWNINYSLRLQITGQNLTNEKHFEFFETSFAVEKTYVERNAYISISKDF